MEKDNLVLLLYPACLERAVFTIHDKNDDEGSQKLGYAEKKPTSHLLGELSINKSQIGESHMAQQCRAREEVEQQAVLCDPPPEISIH